MKVFNMTDALYKDISNVISPYASAQTNYDAIAKVMDQHRVEVDTPQEMWDIYVEVFNINAVREQLTMH